MQTFVCSVKKFNALNPPSRPTPEFLTPPKGVLKSRTNQQFTQTIPEARLDPNLVALLTSCVQTVAARHIQCCLP